MCGPWCTYASSWLYLETTLTRARGTHGVCPRCWFPSGRLSSEANTSYCVTLTCSEHTYYTTTVHQTLDIQTCGT